MLQCNVAEPDNRSEIIWSVLASKRVAPHLIGRIVAAAAVVDQIQIVLQAQTKTHQEEQEQEDTNHLWHLWHNKSGACHKMTSLWGAEIICVCVPPFKN